MPEIGPAGARKIFAAVDAAGFIFHESEQSRAVRSLLSAAFHYHVATAEEYEAQKEFSESQISAMEEFLRSNFSARDETVLKLCFGFDGRLPLHQIEVGRQLGISGERVRQILERSLRRMRHFPRVGILAEMFPDFPEIPHEQLAKQGLPSRVNLRTEDLIEMLDLPVRTHNCLDRAGIVTIGELLELTATMLLKVRNFGKRDLDHVEKALSKFNLHLKA